MRPARPTAAAPSRLAAPATALSPARVATLTSLALLSAGARRHAVAAALALPSCARACPGDARCANCPFARPPSQ